MANIYTIEDNGKTAILTIIIFYNQYMQIWKVNWKIENSYKKMLADIKKLTNHGFAFQGYNEKFDHCPIGNY